jgi:hypothetical protein
LAAGVVLAHFQLVDPTELHHPARHLAGGGVVEAVAAVGGGDDDACVLRAVETLGL